MAFKFCPYRKNITVHTKPWQNAGTIRETSEDFCQCMQEQCPAYIPQTPAKSASCKFVNEGRSSM